MRRLLAFPFGLLGKLATLGVGYLLFGFGVVLLYLVLTVERPVRLVEVDGVVSRVRDYCVVKKMDGVTESGLCEKLEAKLKWDPTRYDNASWAREPYVDLTYLDDDGQQQIRTGRAASLRIPAAVTVGERVRHRVITKKRTWQEWRTDWYDSLLGIAMMIGSFLASALLWTWGGGWRVMTRRGL
jgi:hypothetical protein